MANTAEVINFPVPVVALQELRVADLDDGFTRIANELLEAVMHAGLSQHQLLVFMAVMRKTYGFNKKSDWVSNEQISVLTGILPHKCSAAKSALVKRGILTQTGRVIGINKAVSEWSSLPIKGTEKKPYLKKVTLPESGKKSGTVAKLAMRQPFVLFKGLTFQKLCLPGAFRPGDHHNK
ncbi:replication protein, partial [Klebsiella pneumoniae]|uniref:replication protein n=1 Tax=Klebsiella pneumoniae TaxID=573 RepID=UPI0032D8D58B